ncbi:MAG: hypothetical protein JWO11_893 [Nocardioides sp.]|nr:hypothetical protein [Nocardioides sp.]
MSREELTAWMAEHLRVVSVISDVADTLGDLERQVVQTLDPPLNLDHVKTSPMRVTLRGLRAGGDT